jgi:predicted metalloprotease with PDZ domain
MLKYSIQTDKFNKHLFDVQIHIKKPDPIGQKLSLPTWIAGSYLIRDFAKHLSPIKATTSDDKKQLKVKQLDKNHWQVEPSEKEITISYQVYAFDLSVRSAYLDNTRGFFNGSSVFLEVEGQQNTPCAIKIKPQPNWTIHTALKFDKGFYISNNYQHLIDCPVEMAQTNHFDFNVNGIKHDFVISGKHSCDNERIKKDVALICQHHHTFFGGDLPFEKYLFLLFVNHNDYGGLEHLDSTSLICSRDDLPQKNQIITPEYTRFLALCSHEYFHAWWVKSIKPKSFKNLDFNKEIYTEQLWIFEGFTSYYDELTLLRTQILNLEQYLSLFSQTLTKVYQTPGRFEQTLTNSSFETWTKFYQPNENSVNSQVSYYSKGAIFAFILDIKIRQISNNKKCLNDVLKIIWQDKTLHQNGLENNTIQDIVQQITHYDFTDFFDLALNTTNDLPLKESFAYLGIDFKLVQEKNKNVSLGITTKEQNNALIIKNIFAHSSAETAGLYVGDEIIAINNIKVTKINFNKILQKYSVDSIIKLSIFRDSELQNIKVTLTKTEENICQLTQQKTPTTYMKDNLKSWC